MLVILNILIQCIVAVGEIGGKESALMNMMVLQIGEFVQKPEWWRLVTSVFLHFGWDHLFNNMLVLLYLGALAERCIGKWRFSWCIFNQLALVQMLRLSGGMCIRGICL